VIRYLAGLVQILRTLDTESGVGLAGEIGEQVAFDGRIHASTARNYRQVEVAPLVRTGFPLG